jgi:small subunit ribosomal protein S18e
MGSLVAGQEFQHILRLLNTNVDGRIKIMYALTAIRGIGRRFSNIVCKKAEVDMRKRAGGATSAEVGLMGFIGLGLSSQAALAFSSMQASALLRSWRG